jgi:hypothetical protein
LAGNRPKLHNVASNLSRFRVWAKRLLGASSGRPRTEITILTERVTIVPRRRSQRGWCAECGREVDLLGISEVATLFGSGQPKLQDFADRRGWHVCQEQDGTALICMESLLKAM